MTGNKMIRKIMKNSVQKKKIMACVRQLRYEKKKVRTQKCGQI